MKGVSFLVTGTSQGLGKLLAIKLLQEGALVYGCSRSECDIEHENYLHFNLDISNEEQVSLMFKELASLKASLDCLINNAGLSHSSLAILTRPVIAREIVNVNMLGTFFVTREAVKLMQKARFGRIINFLSIHVALNSIGVSLYSATKSATESMAKSLTQECRNFDITINNLGLSFVANSGMIRELSEEQISSKKLELPKPNVLEIEEIIHAINYFCSPLAKNVSGQTIYFGGI